MRNGQAFLGLSRSGWSCVFLSSLVVLCLVRAPLCWSGSCPLLTTRNPTNPTRPDSDEKPCENAAPTNLPHPAGGVLGVSCWSFLVSSWLLYLFSFRRESTPTVGKIATFTTKRLVSSRQPFSNDKRVGFPHTTTSNRRNRPRFSPLQGPAERWGGRQWMSCQPAMEHTPRLTNVHACTHKLMQKTHSTRVLAVVVADDSEPAPRNGTRDENLVVGELIFGNWRAILQSVSISEQISLCR